MFLFNLEIELPENMDINTYAIELKKSKQPPYRLISTLDLIKLETLKTYIKTYLKIRFISSFKFSTSIFILFNKKLDSSFSLCIGY